jgi:hypothetical protein
MLRTGDGPILFMCDSCPKSFCRDCITRNFGHKEATRIHDLEEWFCFVCCPTERLKKIQVDNTVSLMNIDSVYEKVKPPRKHGNLSTNNVFLFSPIPGELQMKVKDSEKNILSFLTDDLADCNSIFKQIGIIDYLSSRDLRTLHGLSHNIRDVLAHIMVFPGLFRSPHGDNAGYRLYGTIKQILR